MPTGAKLIGAIAFAALAYFVSDLIKPILADTEGSRVGWFSEVNGLIGLVIGWRLMGRGAGETYRKAFGFGLTTLFAIVFWCLLIWSGYKMVQRSMDLRYDGAIEALQSMAQMMVEYAQLVAVPEVIWPAIVGALFMAWLTEYFARRWT